MTQKSLANWVKLIVGAIGVFGVIIFMGILPIWAKAELFMNSDLQGFYWHWMILLWLSNIPCYVVLFYVWKIANQIALDNSFSLENSHYLKNISIIMAGNTVFFFLMNVVYLAMGMSTFSILVVCMILVLIGISITLCSALVSHLVYKAAVLQEQSDLTI